MAALALLAAGIGLTVPASAQTDASSDAQAPATEAASAEAETPVPTATTSRPPGDVITLKTGSVIAGVQVVRKLPNEVVVEVCEGVQLRLPSSQVVSIEFDNLEAEDARRMRKAAASGGGAQLIPGQRMPDVSDRLNKDISMPPRQFSDEDAVAVLKEMCDRAGVELVVDESVENLPPIERWISLFMTSGKPLTLLQILREELPRQAERLTAVYQFDENAVRVVLATKEAAEQLKAAGAVAEPESIEEHRPAAGETAPASAETPAAVDAAAPVPGAA